MEKLSMTGSARLGPMPLKNLPPDGYARSTCGLLCWVVSSLLPCMRPIHSIHVSVNCGTRRGTTEPMAFKFRVCGYDRVA